MHFEIECCQIWKEMLARIWWLNFLNAPSASWLMLVLLFVTMSAITSSASWVIWSWSFSSPNQLIVDFNLIFLGIKQLQYFWENEYIFSYRLYTIEVAHKIISDQGSMQLKNQLIKITGTEGNPLNTFLDKRVLCVFYIFLWHFLIISAKKQNKFPGRWS